MNMPMPCLPGQSNLRALALALVLAPVTFGSPLVPLAARANIVDNHSDLEEKYDYVIIGGGTSGLTVANRLTENPDGKSFVSVMPAFIVSFGF